MTTKILTLGFDSHLESPIDDRKVGDDRRRLWWYHCGSDYLEHCFDGKGDYAGMREVRVLAFKVRARAWMTSCLL